MQEYRNNKNKIKTNTATQNDRIQTPDKNTLKIQKKIVVSKSQYLKKIGNKYILESTLGEGAFAKVKLAKHILTGEKVAIKILKKDKISENEQSPNKNEELTNLSKIKKEINILRMLHHKNIIQLYEIMETDNKLYIVMEYCEGHSLLEYIIKRKKLTECEACRFFQQIINGVEYLHLSNITHRDLKPENLLLDSKKRIKISDFNLSFLSENSSILLSTPCGTPSYSPPEMLRGQKYSGIFSDIWSCGIILYTMLVGNLPCNDSKEKIIYQTIITHNYYYPEYVSDDAIDLIEHMLKIKPEERYNFEEIKAHPWFNILTPKMRPGIVFKVHKMPVDENILNKVETYGMDKIQCKKSILSNNYDSYTALYLLILKQLIRNGNSSVSDLYSDKYLNFIKNYKNWENYAKINDPAFKEYEVDLPLEHFEDNDILLFDYFSDNKIFNQENNINIEVDNVNNEINTSDITNEIKDTKIKNFDDSNDNFNSNLDISEKLLTESIKSNDLLTSQNESSKFNLEKLKTEVSIKQKNMKKRIFNYNTKKNMTITNFKKNYMNQYKPKTRKCSIKYRILNKNRNNYNKNNMLKEKMKIAHSNLNRTMILHQKNNYFINKYKTAIPNKLNDIDIDNESKIVTIPSNSEIKTFCSKDENSSINNSIIGHKNNKFDESSTVSKKDNLYEKTFYKTKKTYVTNYNKTFRKCQTGKYFHNKFKNKKAEEEEKIELLADPLSIEKKQELFNLIKEDVENFDNDLCLLDKIIKPNFIDVGKKCNIVSNMAEKLIKTTIFKNYLLRDKKNNLEIDDLENQFYLLQKYKSIIMLLEKIRNRNYFRKNLHEFNIFSFEEYLNDEDDKNFTQTLMKNPKLNKFITKTKESIYKTNNTNISNNNKFKTNNRNRSVFYNTKSTDKNRIIKRKNYSLSKYDYRFRKSFNKVHNVLDNYLKAKNFTTIRSTTPEVYPFKNNLLIKRKTNYNRYYNNLRNKSKDKTNSRVRKYLSSVDVKDKEKNYLKNKSIKRLNKSYISCRNSSYMNDISESNENVSFSSCDSVIEEETKYPNNLRKKNIGARNRKKINKFLNITSKKLTHNKESNIINYYKKNNYYKKTNKRNSDFNTLKNRYRTKNITNFHNSVICERQRNDHTSLTPIANSKRQMKIRDQSIINNKIRNKKLSLKININNKNNKKSISSKSLIIIDHDIKNEAKDTKNYNTINSKIFDNKIKIKEEIKEFIPIDLRGIFEKEGGELVEKMKKFWRKNGFKWNFGEKEGTGIAKKNRNIIVIKLYRIKYFEEDKSSIYICAKIKDQLGDNLRNVIKNLFDYLHEK